jgi:hypothetical protein
LIGKLIHNRVANESAVEALSKILGGPTEMSKQWGLFANDYFGGLLYPGRRFPALTDLVGTGADSFNIFETSTATEKKFLFVQAPELAMKMFTVRFTSVKEVPDLTDDVVLSAKLTEGQDDVDVHVYAFDSKQSESLGTLTGNNEMLITNAKKHVDNRSLFLFGTVNKRATAKFDTKRNIGLRVGLADPKVTITPREMTGVIGYEYTFTTRNQNIPPSATYTWKVDGKDKSGRSVKASFDRGGEFDVEVRADFDRTSVTDKIKFKIAADTPTKKEEVLFEVLRLYKNSMGTSNQRCQNYTIVVTDRAGKVVESGESIARNGAYSATLLVDTGYQYRVNYTYTTPCPDSGTISGRFDVKQGGSNYVRIETPRCEQ